MLNQLAPIAEPLIERKYNLLNSHQTVFRFLHIIQTNSRNQLLNHPVIQTSSRRYSAVHPMTAVSVPAAYALCPVLSQNIQPDFYFRPSLVSLRRLLSGDYLPMDDNGILSINCTSAIRTAITAKFFDRFMN